MTNFLRRSLRGLTAAILIAAAPIALAPASAQAPAIPGLPDMGEAYDLTPDLVIAFVQSYPVLSEYAETLEGVDVPEGGDPMAAFAAYGAVLEYQAQLNARVADFGFTDFEQWTSVMFSVIFAYSILDAPPDQQPMLMGLFQQPQSNLDAVTVHREAVQTLLDDL